MSPSKSPRSTTTRKSAGKAAAAKKPAANGNTASGNGSPELHELIRQRAYELYLERGGEDGHAAEDWLRAEAEVRAQSKERSA